MQCSFGEFFDDVNDALKEVVRALGGMKTVGHMLWPEISPDTAANRLRDCLSPAKRDKLSIQQFMLLLRQAREVECHSAMAYLLNECGYAPPQPVDADQQLADQQQQFVQAVQGLEALSKRIEKQLAAKQTKPLTRAA